MDVEDATRGEVQQRLLQYLAVGGDDDRFRRKRPQLVESVGRVYPLWLEDGQAVGLGQLLRWRRP